MPIRPSSHKVSRSKSDYGGGRGGVGVVYPHSRQYNIDYIDHGHSHGVDSEGSDDDDSYDRTLPSMLNSTTASEYYDRSTFGPGCGDYGRANATVHEMMMGGRQERGRTPGRLFEGDTSMGYGMDYGIDSVKRPTVTKTRSSRVRDVLLDLLLLGGRSRRRERKEAKRASSCVVVSPRATSLTLQPPRKGDQRRMMSVTRNETNRYDDEERRRDREYCRRKEEEEQERIMEKRREVTWLDERRRRRRRSSRERYMRTPSVDTVLGGSTVGRSRIDMEMEKENNNNNNNYNNRWSRRMAEEPRRKKAREVVRMWETPRPECVKILSLPEDIDPSRRRISKRDAFVNSHEWTLSRNVSELHLGIIGCPLSGKTPLVHRYLTGSFQPEESPEGGRFKKEVVLEGQSHLLLIRDEGVAPPDAQFTLWADAVLFVFAVDSWETFTRLEYLYNLMCDYRSLVDMPVILVGTKETVSESSPRMVTEEAGKRMAHKFGRCAYFETHAGYGTNVEKVFKDACLKMFHSRRLSLGGLRTPTPTEKYATDPRMSSLYGPSGTTSVSSARGTGGNYGYGSGSGPSAHHQRSVSAVPMPDQQSRSSKHAVAYANSMNSRAPSAYSTAPSSSFASRASQLDPRGISPSSSQKSISSVSNGQLYTRSSAALLDNNHHYPMSSSGVGVSSSVSSMGGATTMDVGGASASTSHLPTPSSTPTTQRKNRRISNIFQRPSKEHGSSSHTGHNHHSSSSATGGPDEGKVTRDVGQGRAIPIMQGQLYKRSGGKSALNRGEWKKKFVTLTNDGKLTYHQSLKEYMDNGSGKEVFLGLAAVRLPGRQRMRNSQAVSMTLVEKEGDGSEQRTPRESSTTGVHGPVASGEGTSGGGSDDGVIGSSNPAPALSSLAASIPMTPQTVATSKKRRGYSRKIGGGKGNDDDEECFEIVTCDQKRWEFCAASVEEREEWVKAIEGQIDAALQKQTSQPSNQARVLGARAEVTAILSIAGNDSCADCAATRPEWASLNIGTLICMDCSGIHRNLGSHISRVRSLKFDEWPVEYLSVMRSIGNRAAARLWEASLTTEQRPRADASPEEREAFIRSKYVDKKWLAPAANDRTPIGAQLISAVLAADVPSVCALLARASNTDVNTTVSSTDRRTVLHLACSSGRVDIVQLLLWNNADVRALDECGRSALWHARNGDAKECAAVLVAAGLPADYGLASGGDDNNSASLSSATGRMHEPQVILGSMSSRDYTDSTRRMTSVGNA